MAFHEADLAAVTQLVRCHVPEAVFLESIGQEITFILPYSGARDGTFAALFQKLDLAMADLGLTSYGISDTTLEEVNIWDVGVQTYTEWFQQR